MIAVRRFGTGPPVVALHGFTLTGEQFADAPQRLGRTVIAPDLPGHGHSVDASTEFQDVIDAITTTLEEVPLPVPLVGYSQGGRLALLYTVANPDRVSALVLVSATAGIEDAEQWAARTAADAKLAETLRTTPLEQFLDSWTSRGITSTRHLTVEARQADREMRNVNTADGLAEAVVGYGQGAQRSVWDELDTLTIPVLIVSGSLDQKFTEIGERMAIQIPRAQHVSIGGSGHNPLLDAPHETYDAISAFLDGDGRA